MQIDLVLRPRLRAVLPRPFGLDSVLRVPAPPSLIERTLTILRSTAADTAGRGRSKATRSSAGSGGSGRTRPGSDPSVPAEASLTMEQLVHDHADAVYRVALSVTRDPVLAEDASQDALIKAWQALPTFRGEAPLRHWILRITHNVSISLLRKRREEAIAPLEFPEQVAKGPGVESQVQDRLAIDRFEVALRELDGISRSIVVLREVEGMSYNEMSDVLQLPLPTIRTRLLRARRQLADALDGWQP